MLLLKLASGAVAAVLILFTLRRAVLLVAAILHGRGDSLIRSRTSTAPEQPLVPNSQSAISPGPRGAAGAGNLQSHGDASQSRFILIIIPCRNEARILPRLLARLEEMEYPPPAVETAPTETQSLPSQAGLQPPQGVFVSSMPRLRVARTKGFGILVIDDGSSDDTAVLARAWVADRPYARVLSIAESRGKASALNRAIEHWESQPGLPHPELIAVYDSDLLPAPDSLSLLAQVFDDPRVAAANGMLLPVNRRASLPAFYAAVETLVNQLVTMLGKDRLRLAPAILGSNCLYRLSALRESGGFREGFLLEDSDLTVTLARAGYRTRYLPEAVAETTVPETWRGYWRQHVRWGHGFNQVAARQSRQLWRGGLPFLLRFELLLFSLGYFDRLALLAACGMVATDILRPGLTSFPPFLLLPYFLLPLLSMTAVLLRLREPLSSFARLLLTPLVFAVDLAAALYSTALALYRRPARWAQTERPNQPMEAR